MQDFHISGNTYITSTLQNITLKLQYTGQGV